MARVGGKAGAPGAVPKAPAEAPTETAAAAGPRRKRKAARTPAPVKDSESFDAAPARAEMNPAVSRGMQAATWKAVLEAGHALALQGKIPVLALDFFLTTLDNRPTIIDGLKQLAQDNHIPELMDPEGALKAGTLKSLPGYTAEASDAWRDEHPDLVKKHPVLNHRGTRLDPGFMGRGIARAKAVAGLKELVGAWKRATHVEIDDPTAPGGKRVIDGKVVLMGSGTGSDAELFNIFTRPVSEGGAGLDPADFEIRHGAPPESPEAHQRAVALAAKFNAAHPGEPPVVLDFDSAGKGGWIETLERQKGPNGEEMVVVAVADDRAHNRIEMQGAAKRGEDLIAIKADAPGVSVSQIDNANPYQISTFYPNP